MKMSLLEDLKKWNPEIEEKYKSFKEGKIILCYRDTGYSFNGNYKQFDDFSSYLLYYYNENLHLVGCENYKTRVIGKELENLVIFRTLFNNVDDYEEFSLDDFFERVKEITKDKNKQLECFLESFYYDKGKICQPALYYSEEKPYSAGCEYNKEDFIVNLVELYFNYLEEGRYEQLFDEENLVDRDE